MKNDRIKNDRIKNNRMKNDRIKSARIKTDRIRSITDPSFLLNFAKLFNEIPRNFANLLVRNFTKVPTNKF
jgi:hypothetical protein